MVVMGDLPARLLRFGLVMDGGRADSLSEDVRAEDIVALESRDDDLGKFKN